MKTLEILFKNNQNVTQKHKASKCRWKNSSNRLAHCRVATDLQFVKKKTKKNPNKQTNKKTPTESSKYAVCG